MDKFNVLIIEDESLMAMELAAKITEFGYEVVDYATNTVMAKEMLQKYQVDMILLDINLGEERNGIEFYQNLGIDTPVIYLTAYKDEKTISEAIETDPIGYLTKPYKEEELQALLKLAHFKHQSKSKENLSDQGNIIHLNGHYHFESKERKLYKDQSYINLGEKELQLLELLIAVKGNFVTFQMIEDYLYSDSIINGSTLRTLIYRLRKKLGHELIESKFNHGVKLILS